MRFWEPKMRFWEPKIHQTFLLLLTKPPPPRNLTGPTPSLKPGPRLDVSKTLCPIQDFADFSLAPAIIGFHYPLMHLPMKPVDSQLMKQQKKEGESLFDKKEPNPQGAATRVTPSPRFRISPVVSGAVAFGALEPSTLAASPHKTRHPSEGVTCAENDLPFETSALEY